MRITKDFRPIVTSAVVMGFILAGSFTHIYVCFNERLWGF